MIFPNPFLPKSSVHTKVEAEMSSGILRAIPDHLRQLPDTGGYKGQDQNQPKPRARRGATLLSHQAVLPQSPAQSDLCKCTLTLVVLFHTSALLQVWEHISGGREREDERDE